MLLPLKNKNYFTLDNFVVDTLSGLLQYFPKIGDRKKIVEISFRLFYDKKREKKFYVH